MAQQVTGAMQECIDRCQSCEESCLSTAMYSLAKGGKHAAPEHVQTLLACAEICDTSARFMLFGSQFHRRTCEMCAEICEACAIECERLNGDEVMQQCAESCRRCAESCREMAASVSTRARRVQARGST